MKAVCLNCRFFKDGPLFNSGDCRKHGPGREDGNPSLGYPVGCKWPIVNYRDWCGDYQLKENEDG